MLTDPTTAQFVSFGHGFQFTAACGYTLSIITSNYVAEYPYEGKVVDEVEIMLITPAREYAYDCAARVDAADMPKVLAYVAGLPAGATPSLSALAALGCHGNPPRDSDNEG